MKDISDNFNISFFYWESELKCKIIDGNRFKYSTEMTDQLFLLSVKMCL